MTDHDDAPFSSSAPPVRSTVPPPDVVNAIREAQEGPPDSRDDGPPETKVRCPTCAGSGYCSPLVASECDRLRSANPPPVDPTR